MLYINMFGAKRVCRFLCKCYASFIVAYGRCWSFVHVFRIRQKLSKPNCIFVQWLVAMYFSYVVDNAMVGCILHFRKYL